MKVPSFWKSAIARSGEPSETVTSFPSGAHDDDVDSLVVALNEQMAMGEGIGIST